MGGGGLSQTQFEETACAPEAARLGLEEALVQRGVLKDVELGQLMAWWYQVPFVNLEQTHVSEDMRGLLPETFIRSHGLVPVSSKDGSVLVATTDPRDAPIRSLLEKYLRKSVSFAYATSRDIQGHMSLFREDPAVSFAGLFERFQTGALEAGAATVELVALMIESAFQAGASDVHLDPEDAYTAIRYRVDGLLRDMAEIPPALQDSVISRLKVLGRLATDEHRTAQDGKITFASSWGQEIEIRLSIIPTTHGEKAVMRLLTDKSRDFSLSDLGLHPDDAQKLSDMLRRSWGMFLVTGPTGSGKSTTLYAALKILNRREANITTIEDPVEYDMVGVNQIQVDERADLTFAKGLRSIVRQDPNVIMVGEIRDTETAHIAVNAAMTGHLVLSTLHTNDAATAFPRLADMQVDDFLIASTVNAILAQRLVRRICMSCIQTSPLTQTEVHLLERVPEIRKELLGLADKRDLVHVRLFKGKGCGVCHQSGYHGRVGVFEFLRVTDAVRTAVMERRNADDIRAAALKEGMIPMLSDGLRKAMTGLTSVEEVLRAVRI